MYRVNGYNNVGYFSPTSKSCIRWRWLVEGISDIYNAERSAVYELPVQSVGCVDTANGLGK
jgi:hypothetical protein